MKTNWLLLKKTVEVTHRCVVERCLMTGWPLKNRLPRIKLFVV